MIKISLLILGGIILWFILFTLMRCIDTSWTGNLKDLFKFKD
jgi:hypothetical protein